MTACQTGDCRGQPSASPPPVWRALVFSMGALFAYRGVPSLLRRPRLRGSALALGVLALFTSKPARATTALDIPLECGTRAAFDSELRKRLGDAAPTGSVQVSITRGLQRSHLRVQIGSEVRELDDASCTELFRASVVVAVAMLMHEPPPQSEAPPVVAPLSPPREYPRFSVGAGAGLSVGTLPNPVLALELESKALWQHLGVSVNLRYLLPTEELDAQQKGVELQAWSAGVSGLFRPSRQWEARLGFAAQRLSGQGAGNISHKQENTIWAAGPTLGLAFIPFQGRRFWAGVGAEGQLNAVRGTFQILHYSQQLTDPPYDIYPVPWLAGSAFVRLGLVW